jgi:hypothetical protein
LSGLWWGSNKMMPTDTCLQCAQEMPAISTKIITNTVTVFQALWKAVGWWLPLFQAIPR